MVEYVVDQVPLSNCTQIGHAVQGAARGLHKNQMFCPVHKVRGILALIGCADSTERRSTRQLVAQHPSAAGLRSRDGVSSCWKFLFAVGRNDQSLLSYVTEFHDVHRSRLGGLWPPSLCRLPSHGCSSHARGIIGALSHWKCT